jgi:hypothetical protein
MTRSVGVCFHRLQRGLALCPVPVRQEVIRGAGSRDDLSGAHTEPLSPTDGSPFGPRQYWQVSEVSLDGDRIHARLASTGIDWMSMGPDGLYRPDVRAAFVTDDDAVVLMHYTGLVEPLPAFQAAAAEDRETGWEDQRIRLVVIFDSGDERYRWLTS